MTKLNNYIKEKIRYNINYNTNYYYSGSDECGEGEHKIFNILKNIDNNKKIVIHGLDADLIILSLISHKKNIILMREKDEKNIKDFKYLNIYELRKAIISDLIIKWNLNNNDYEDIFSNNSNISLYDLEKDPYELNNLAKDQSQNELLLKMNTKLNALMEKEVGLENHVVHLPGPDWFWTT